MQQSKILLTENQKILWAEAGHNSPGEQLDKVLQRALIDLTVQSVDKLQCNFYEVRRFDVPHAFNTLLKLQCTRAAWRHIEVGNDEFREVLCIEEVFFELIMRAIELLLDVILRVLCHVPKFSSSRSTESPKEPPTVAPPIQHIYVPTWKRQLSIECDHGGYTS